MFSGSGVIYAILKNAIVENCSNQWDWKDLKDKLSIHSARGRNRASERKRKKDYESERARNKDKERKDER